MVESLASGTPVIAMNLGSAPEVIAHGKTGFLCNSVEECITALSKIETISRTACRDHVNQRFNVQRMVDGYEAVYREIVAGQFARNGRFASSIAAMSTRN